LVLGGFISRERARDQDALPGLSGIPILGGLFGVKREQERHTELAIFVTPMIVDPRDPGLAARVVNAQGVLQDSFPASPLLNTPLITPASPFEPLELMAPSSSVETFGQWESDTDATQAVTNPLSQWEDTPASSHR
jgi:pilus assembly protein CpaC